MKPTANPLIPLMRDESVTEIMVNRFDSVFIEQDGLLKNSHLTFPSQKSFEDYVDKLLENSGVNRKEGLFYDGAIAGKYRFNVVIPPMSLYGPILTIRLFSETKFRLKTLVEKGSISEKCVEFLQKIVQAKMNIIVSGGTGSGKTTFLQALSSEIPENERIVTVEDVPELSLHQKNWVQLLSVNQGTRVATIRDCLINSLRMRPDRIIVGECRRDETFEMLQAMNTGHAGSMTTIHANNTTDCLTRMENLLISAGYEVNNKYIRRQISDTIHFIVQLGRTPKGGRLVTDITEITGMEGDMITRSTIFQNIKGRSLKATGLVPKVIQEIEEKAGKFPSDFW